MADVGNVVRCRVSGDRMTCQLSADGKGKVVFGAVQEIQVKSEIPAALMKMLPGVEEIVCHRREDIVFCKVATKPELLVEAVTTPQATVEQLVEAAFKGGA